MSLRTSSFRVRRSCPQWAPHTDGVDSRRREQVDDPYPEVARKPGEALDRQILAPPFESTEIAHAHPELLCPGLARQATALAKLDQTQSDVVEEAIGIFATHDAKEAPRSLAKRGTYMVRSPSDDRVDRRPEEDQRLGPDNVPGRWQAADYSPLGRETRTMKVKSITASIHTIAILTILACACEVQVVQSPRPQPLPPVSRSRAAPMPTTAAPRTATASPAPMPTTAAPLTATASPAGSVTPPTSRVACVVGRHLSGPDRRDRTFHWDLIQAARQGVKSGQGLSLSAACQFAKDFADNCPAWDPDVATVKEEVCTHAEADPCADVGNWAESTKRASASMMRGQLATHLKPVDVSVLDDPNDARRALPQVRKTAGLLRCYDPSAAAEVDEQVSRWSAALDAAIAQELTCRASPECLAQRVGGQICGVLADRREAVVTMAREKSNPGGVVALVTLHDLGEKIQFDDARLGQLRANYTALAHRAFSDGTCSH